MTWFVGGTHKLFLNSHKKNRRLKWRPGWAEWCASLRTVTFQSRILLIPMDANDAPCETLQSDAAYPTSSSGITMVHCIHYVQSFWAWHANHTIFLREQKPCFTSKGHDTVLCCWTYHTPTLLLIISGFLSQSIFIV